MRSICLSALAAAFLAALVPAAFAADRGEWVAPMMAPAMAVQAGQAPIDQALGRIVPAPYRIELDKNVPAAALLVWAAGDNWMDVLKRAVAPLNLVVIPDWQRNTVRVVLAPTIPTPRRAPFVAPAAPSVPTFMPVPGKVAEAKRVAVADPAISRSESSIIAPAGSSSALPAAVATSVKRPAVKPPSYAYTIPNGKRLSEGLADYVKARGWQLRWQVSQDYVLDAPLPIPDLPIKDGLKYVLRAYQAQGGLLDVTFDLAAPNRVAVARPATALEH